MIRTERCLCTNNTFIPIMKFKNGRQLFQCKKCNLVQILPYPKPIKRNMTIINYSIPEIYGCFMIFFNIIKKLNLKREIKILDFGSGISLYSKFFNNKQYYNTISYDINKNLINFSKKEFNIKNAYYTFQKIKRIRFDLIIANHVFEHIININQLINADLFDILNTNGHIIFAVPNYSSFNRIILKRNWIGYSPYEHIWLFTKNDINNHYKRNEKYELIECYSKSPINTKYDGYCGKTLLKKIYYNTIMRIFEYVGKGDQLIVILKKKSNIR